MRQEDPSRGWGGDSEVLGEGRLKYVSLFSVEVEGNHCVLESGVFLLRTCAGHFFQC